MKKSIRNFYLMMAVCLIGALSAQKRVEEFTISLPAKKAEKSYYKTIKLIDDRIDTTSMGIVQQGALNAKARVVPTSPIVDQFQSILNTINGENAEDGTLLLYLKQLYFAEVTSSFSQHGYCYFQGFLFSKNDDGTYSLIDKTDTVIDHKASDVTKETLKKGSEMLGDFIARNVAKKPEATAERYTFEQIKNYDDIEKRSISLFSSSPLKDGVYKDYTSLKNQQPQQEITNAKFYGNMPKIVRIYETVDGKEKEIKKDDIYAVIYKGDPYIYLPIENLFTKAEKRNNDYYFVGKIRSGTNTGSLISASAMFGVMGVLIASNPAYPFEQKIDYINGGFIPIKEIQSKRY